MPCIGQVVTGQLVAARGGTYRQQLPPGRSRVPECSCAGARPLCAPTSRCGHKVSGRPEPHRCGDALFLRAGAPPLPSNGRCGSQAVTRRSSTASERGAPTGWLRLPLTFRSVLAIGALVRCCAARLSYIRARSATSWARLAARGVRTPPPRAQVASSPSLSPRGGLFSWAPAGVAEFSWMAISLVVTRYQNTVLS